MHHEEAVRTGLTEKYLLNELTPEVRDQFEEHLFDCRECATDLRAAGAFLEHSKVVLSEPDTARVPRPAQPETKRAWFSWLTPAFAAPALAILLAVVAYQSLRAPHSGAVSPSLVRSVSLITANTRGGSTPVVEVARETPFIVFVDVPPQPGFVSYAAELYDPSGSKQWSFPVSPASIKETLAIQIPGVPKDGTYSLAVRGSKDSGDGVEVARYAFDVRLK